MEGDIYLSLHSSELYGSTRGVIGLCAAVQPSVQPSVIPAVEADIDSSASGVPAIHKSSHPGWHASSQCGPS